MAYAARSAILQLPSPVEVDALMTPEERKQLAELLAAEISSAVQGDAAGSMRMWRWVLYVGVPGMATAALAGLAMLVVMYFDVQLLKKDTIDHQAEHTVAGARWEAEHETGKSTLLRHEERLHKHGVDLGQIKGRMDID